MKHILLTSIIALSAHSAFADICGIVKTKQGRAAAAIVDAQIERNIKNGNGKVAYLFNGSEYIAVTDALVSNKNGFMLSDGKYYDFKVKEKTSGKMIAIDVGYAWIVIGNKRISLDVLTGCGNFVAEENAVVEVNSNLSNIGMSKNTIDASEAVEVSVDANGNMNEFSH